MIKSVFRWYAKVIVIVLAFDVNADSVSLDYIKGEGDVDGIKLAYQFYQRDLSALLPNLALSLETSANFWEYGADNNHDSNFVLAISPVFKKIFCFCEHGRFFGEFGIGLSLIDDTRFAGKNISTHYQFEDRLGIGYEFGRNYRYRVALRYFHYSNGGIKKPNPGLDFLSLSFLYKL